MQRWPRRNLIASEGLFCTEGAQEMQKAEAAIFCDLRCCAEKDSVPHRTVDRDRTLEPKLVLSVGRSCLSPNWATEIKFPSSLRLFQDWHGTPTPSSVLVVRDLRQRMDVRFSEGRNRRDTIFTLMGQQKTNRRSLSVDPAHSRCARVESYLYRGGVAKVARKARLARASLCDGFSRVRMFLMASSPAKTRMLLQVDRYSFLVVRQGTLVCIVCTVRADFSSPHFAVAGLRCNFLEINRSQRGERNGSCCCRRTNNLQRRVPMMTIDPVCGVEVDEQETELQTQYAGKKYSFCSEECLTAFERQPSQYSRAAKAA